MTCAFDQTSPSSRPLHAEATIYVGVVDDTWTPERAKCGVEGHDGYLSAPILTSKQILTCSGDHTCMIFDIPNERQ